MVTRLRRRSSRSARWSLRIARFAIPVFILAAAFHQFGIFATNTLMILYGIIWIGNVIAIVLGIVGLLAIWSHGLDGARRALLGIGLSLPLIAIPIYFAWLTLSYPQLNDISTNLRDPPSFIQISGLRPADANPVPSSYSPEEAMLQRDAYGDIRPLFLGSSVEDTYQAALRVVRDAGWRIVVEEPPLEANSPGRIQAVAKTMFSGFSDDIIILVGTDLGDTRVDVRSVSRYGRHDFGVNARRIKAFMIALQEAVAPTLGNS